MHKQLSVDLQVFSILLFRLSIYMRYLSSDMNLPGSHGGELKGFLKQYYLAETMRVWGC